MKSADLKISISQKVLNLLILNLEDILIIKYILSIHKFVAYDTILIIFGSQIDLQNTIKLVRGFGDRRMFSSKVLGVILDTVSNDFVMYFCCNVS